MLPPPDMSPAVAAAMSKSDRAIYALEEMGPPVLNGALSTFLAVVCIATSPYTYFVKYFFGIYAITMAVCSWNALIALPVLLSYIAPRVSEARTDNGSKASVYPESQSTTVPAQGTIVAATTVAQSSPPTIET